MPSQTASPPLSELLASVCSIADEASRRILSIYESDFAVSDKEDRSPLTEADLAAHATLCEGLKRLDPALPVLSEEAADVPYAERASWDRYWLVDPLDGTKEFIKRNGEFTVNVALIEDHEPILGVVQLPVTGVTYYAARGVGSFKREGTAAPTALRTRRADPEALVVSGSRSHGGEALQAFVDKLPGHVELVSRGSSLKFCLVAEGKADIYPRFGPTSEWDTAAAHCVVREAGGQVTDLHFAPLRYNEKDELLNPHFLVIGDPSYDWRTPLAQALKHNG